MKNDYRLLTQYICRDDCKTVSKILANNSSIDVTHKEGKFFIISVESNNYDIVEALLNYFEENQLEKYEPRTHKYVALKNKMRDILKLAIEDVEVSEEMQKVLSGYIDFSSDEESDDDSQDLGSDDEELSFDFSNHQTNNYNEESVLTEANLEKHNKLMGDNSSGIDVY